MYTSDVMLRALLDATRDAMIVVDPEGTIVFANEAVAAVFGWPREELVGQSVDVLVPPSLTAAHPTLRARYLADPTRRTMGEDMPLRAMRRDGSQFPVELSLNAIEVPGGHLVAAVVRDVTRVRQGETRLRAVLAAVPDAIIGVSSDGTIEMVSDQAERLFGWTSAELIGQKIEVLVPPAAREQHLHHREAFAAHPETRPMGLGIELCGLRKDGTTFPAEISLGIVAAGAHGGVTLAAVRDITDRIAQAERAQLSRAESERMESLGQLAGGIAHDFNNLLGVILNYATLAARRAEDPIAVADLGEIRTAAELGAGLTRQLLAFARQEPVVTEVVDVAAAVREARWLIERTVGAGIDVVLDLDGASPTASFGRGQLEQILLNLALNSRAAMLDGGVLTVRVTDSVAGSAPRLVMLTVSDTGVGMSPEVAEHAFEPFFSTKPLGQGTGLGLASVYGIVRQNHGRVTIRSALGEGTTVEITLPYVPAEQNHPKTDPGKQGGHGERILVVEDEPALRTTTARLLADSGYKVAEAEDGREALDILERGTPIDLIVSDVGLPRLRGDMLAAEVDKRWPGLPLIFVTGHDSGEPALTRTTLDKPVDEAQLLAAVREALDD